MDNAPCGLCGFPVADFLPYIKVPESGNYYHVDCVLQWRADHPEMIEPDHKKEQEKGTDNDTDETL